MLYSELYLSAFLRCHSFLKSFIFQDVCCYCCTWNACRCGDHGVSDPRPTLVFEPGWCAEILSISICTLDWLSYTLKLSETNSQLTPEPTAIYIYHLAFSMTQMRCTFFLPRCNLCWFGFLPSPHYVPFWCLHGTRLFGWAKPTSPAEATAKATAMPRENRERGVFRHKEPAVTAIKFLHFQHPEYALLKRFSRFIGLKWVCWKYEFIEINPARNNNASKTGGFSMAILNPGFNRTCTYKSRSWNYNSVSDLRRDPFDHQMIFKVSRDSVTVVFFCALAKTTSNVRDEKG